MNGCLPSVSQHRNKEGEWKKLNHLGRDVGKRKCRAALKDDRGVILDEFFFGNNSDEIIKWLKGYIIVELKNVMQYWNLLVICEDENTL